MSDYGLYSNGRVGRSNPLRYAPAPVVNNDGENSVSVSVSVSDSDNASAKKAKRPRVRQVFPTDEIPHLWAHQTQSNARNPHGNFYFIGPTIYSYGEHFPIATIATNRRGERAYIVTTRLYSPTTRGHIYMAQRAIPHNSVVFRTPPDDYLHHHSDPRACIRNYQSEIEAKIAEAAKATGLRNRHYVTAWDLRAEMERFVAFFGLPAMSERARLPERKIPVIPVPRAVAERLAAERDAVITAKQQERRRRTAAVHYEEWKQGNDSSTYEFYDFPVALRVKDDMLETSKGARVPLADARRVLQAVKDVRATGQEWTPQGLSFLKVGHYQVNKITAEGELHAGCHVIAWDEIARVAPEVTGPIQQAG